MTGLANKAVDVRYAYKASLIGEAHQFELTDEGTTPGASPAGISEAFPLDGSRTLYGATKLASELLIEEYRQMFGLRAASLRSLASLAGAGKKGHRGHVSDNPARTSAARH